MSGGAALLDPHVGITKTDDFICSVLTTLQNELLWTIRGASRLVAFHFVFGDAGQSDSLKQG